MQCMRSSLRGRDCTLSRLSSFYGECNRPVIQSTANPEPRSLVPTFDRKLELLFKALDVSPHPGADGLVQVEPPVPLNVDRFHKP